MSVRETAHWTGLISETFVVHTGPARACQSPVVRTRTNAGRTDLAPAPRSRLCLTVATRDRISCRHETTGAAQVSRAVRWGRCRVSRPETSVNPIRDNANGCGLQG